jgi:hypothetical protein
MEADLLTTEQLTCRLNRAGLAVTTNMLKQDVRDGYLAHRVDSQDADGVRGWDTGAIRRAFYLYRLRKLGLKGDILRFFLFLRDGYGWERLKQVSLEGIRKAVQTDESYVRRRTRHITPTGLNTLMEDLTAEAQISEPLARHVWGLGLFGKPLPGGSVRPLFERLASTFDVAVDAGDITLVENRVVEAGLMWKDYEPIVLQADELTVEMARLAFWSQVHLWRRMFVRFFRKASPTERRGFSTNLLGLFGMPQDEFSSYLRKQLRRPTLAQLIGCLFGGAIISCHVLRQEIMSTLLTPKSGSHKLLSRLLQ